MKSAHLFCVGKLKDKNIQTLEQSYLKRLKIRLEVTEFKSDEHLLTRAKEIKNRQVVMLTEHGKVMDTPAFSLWLEKNIERAEQLIFVVAGHDGPGAKLLALADMELSLSPLTFPHELARLLFVEQYYRAQTLREGHPYHY